MEARNVQVTPLPAVSAKRLLKLERSGRFAEALAFCGDGWENSDFLPAADDLRASGSAEILLRFGSLIGFHGYRHRIAGSQERSKNIVTHARELFTDLKDEAKIAECENHIALAYWRTGEFREADTWVETALSHELPVDCDARLYAQITKSLILLAERHDHQNITFCRAIEQNLRHFGDGFLSGSLYSNLGISYRNLFQNAEAMRYFSLAKQAFEKAGHKTCLGIVQNNLALLYNAERKFESAHDLADAAVKLYKQVKDKTREASTLDSKAQIYLTERRLPEALATIDRSIAMLKKSEGTAYLAESLLTRAKILAMSDEMGEAMLSLVEAVNITRLNAGEQAAKDLAEEFALALKEKELPLTTPPMPAIRTTEMELVLPASIAAYDDYKGVWIQTDHLESSGLPKGALAVVVPGNVGRGDIVAIAENEGGSIVCGVYDSEFGIVCLDRGDDEPLLFDETLITVLGKIVGVCRNGKSADGKMHVEALAG